MISNAIDADRSAKLLNRELWIDASCGGCLNLPEVTREG